MSLSHLLSASGYITYLSGDPFTNKDLLNQYDVKVIDEWLIMKYQDK